MTKTRAFELARQWAAETGEAQLVILDELDERKAEWERYFPTLEHRYLPMEGELIIAEVARDGEVRF